MAADRLTDEELGGSDAEREMTTEEEARAEYISKHGGGVPAVAAAQVDPYLTRSVQNFIAMVERTVEQAMRPHVDHERAEHGGVFPTCVIPMYGDVLEAIRKTEVDLSAMILVLLLQERSSVSPDQEPAEGA